MFISEQEGAKMCIVIKPSLSWDNTIIKGNFNLNQVALSKIKENFVKNEKNVEDIIISYYNNIDDLSKLIDDLNLFDNNPYHSYGMGLYNVSALLEAHLTGWQPQDAQNFKNERLKKLKNIVKNNDKLGFLELIQSINRESKDNNKIRISYESDVKNFEYLTNNPWDNLPDVGDSPKIRAGNRYKKREKKLKIKNDRNTGSLFDGID